MRLTEEGEQLLGEVIGPLRQLDAALQNIRCFSSGISGSVTVGLPPTVSYFLAQPLLERVSLEEPNIAVRIVEGTSKHLNDWLLSGDLDIAVLYGPSTDDKLRTCDLVVEDMVLVGSSQSDLSPQRTVSLKELTALPLILPNPRNELRAVSERLSAKYKTRFHVKYVIDSIYILKEMVRGGHGYTIMPVSAVMKEIEDGSLKYAPIENTNTRTLVLATQANFRGHRIMSKMDQIIQDAVFELYENKRIFGDMKIVRPGSSEVKPLLRAV